MDEPLTGLDPLAIVKLREIILEAKKRNISFLVSSHILSEVEKICDEIAVLKQGRLELKTTLESLTAQGKTVETIFTDILRDGTLEGPNIAEIQKVMKKTKMKVYASGGVSKIEDVVALKKIPKLAGVIIGKALYDGRVTLEDCLKA